ncbi:putative isomerase YbhE [Karstenula rhodostoma CBS 690.94]|uniref:Isomerase YbhE n=1 Tax=Karstenula rhodostoma CBS 690.94 TaxID=1392251 RepID=A0A9P4U579_9PLEO|nr:putative isomerase YbhE [Karstenula rhodostoma CBS 690.94]
MSLRTLLIAGLATSASAAKLLVGGYGPTSATIADGYIDTLDYTNGVLKKTAENTEAGAQPAWIDLGLKGKALVVDESWGTPESSSLHTFALNADGSVQHTAVASIPRGGPVSTQLYNGGKNLAIAHYGGHGLTTFSNVNGAFTLLQNIGYENRTTGPKPQQKDGSHVHHSVLDPTGQYVIFPDLGLDVTHVFCIDSATGKLVEHAELQAPTGYGPRHAAFWKSGSKTYLFVIHELVSKVISYEVTYVRSGGLTFKKIDEQSTYGPNADPAITQYGAAAEIAVSPDNKFLVASNRNVTLAQVPNVDPANSTQIDSNSIATFKPSSNGKLAWVQLAPSGGLFPRHFELNKDGSQIAVANQNSGNVRIYKRDVKSGKIGAQAAAIAVPGSPNNVRWL